MPLRRPQEVWITMNRLTWFLIAVFVFGAAASGLAQPINVTLMGLPCSSPASSRRL